MKYYGLGIMLAAIPASGYFYVIEGSIFGGLFFGGLAVFGTYLYGFKDPVEGSKKKGDFSE